MAMVTVMVMVLVMVINDNNNLILGRQRREWSPNLLSHGLM